MKIVEKIVAKLGLDLQEEGLGLDLQEVENRITNKELLAVAMTVEMYR